MDNKEDPMMRLTGICLPLVLGPVLLAAQQAQPSQKPAQSSEVKPPSGQNAHRATTTQKSTHHRARARRVKSSRKRKRPEYRPKYKENSVEVINGDATKKVTFHEDEPGPVSKKNARAGLKNVPAPLKVDVLNGTSTDTQYFYAQDEQNEDARNRPVVIGVQSSDTRMAGGNKHPVVTSITSSSGTDAKAESAGGEPVTKSVAPRPKRPDYEPDSH
jgi:hypothetical protein